MKWRYQAVFAVLMSVFVVAMAPGAAAASGDEQLVVGSSHGSDTELSSGTLTNTTVTGSGESASVVYDEYNGTIASRWPLNDGSGSTATDVADSRPLSLFGPSWTSGYAGQALTFDGSQGDFANSSKWAGQEMTVAMWVNPDNVDTSTSEMVINDRSYNRWRLFFNGGELKFAVSDSSGTYHEITSTAVSSGDWSHVGATYDPNSGDMELYVNGTAVNSTTTGGGYEKVSDEVVVGTGGSQNTDWYFNGSVDETRLYHSVLSGAALTRLYQTPEYTQETGQYISADHSVDNAAKGWTNITLDNASADVRWEYYDGSTWQVSNSSTFTSTGNYTLDISASSDKWRVDVTFNNQTGASTAKLHDEGILFTDHAPSVDNSSATPSDGATLTERQTTFSINVSDREFPTAQGDSVTATLYVDGSAVGSETITSNGTVSVSHQLSEGGEHTYHWELSDSYGLTAQSQTNTISVPSELQVRKEGQPSQLVDNATVTIRFYFNNEDTVDQIVTRNTSSGSINMTGLPADQPFIVTAEAEGYENRRIFVPSLYEQQSIYLLNTSEPSIEQLFDLQDFTGKYPSDSTVMFAQRALTRDYDGDGTNETRWATVLGDYFGATGEFSAIIRSDTRYRIIVRNVETGEETVLGEYTPIASGTKTVRVTSQGAVIVEEAAATISVAPNPRRLPAGNVSVSATVDNQSNTLDWWNVTVVFRNNTTSNTLFTQNSSDSAGGTVNPELDLGGKAGGTVWVNVSLATTGGAVKSDTVPITVERFMKNQFALLPTLLSMPGDLLPDANVGSFTTMIAILMTVLGTTAIASEFPASSEQVGLVATGFLGVFSIIGWVGYNIVFVAGVAWVSMAALRRGI